MKQLAAAELWASLRAGAGGAHAGGLVEGEKVDGEEGWQV